MVLSGEQIRQEAKDIHTEEKWGDRKYIHMKNIYSEPMKFGLLLREEKDAVYSFTTEYDSSVLMLKFSDLVLHKKYTSTEELVSDGWIVD